ncbi:MAG: hypothetical protein F4082_04545 [Gammaproteobacteria bacterium]|nr:hypothetical protein [Gammaproteobacteria bacterium]
MTIPEPKKYKQFLEEQKAKEELEKYDIYSMNEETWKQVQDADRRKDFHPIDDIKAFIERYR